MESGQSATVTVGESSDGNEVAVVPSLDWGWASADLDGAGVTSHSQQDVIVLKRSEVALWDYPSASDWGFVDNVSIPKTRNVSDSRQDLLDTLSKLQTSETSLSKTDAPGTTSLQSGSVPSSKFMSSRERKAANAASKKEKQRAKKKGKKKGSVYLANRPK